ncbi:hypothetical protein E2C01_087085 [Portunus trituberculatus]|uniref:Uncharacterized protein n=1 Tax=Portunus trituberculatus TaxID=210409 RepID=A0A5B7JF78_PORTR|nr:hypothetical protein [Portunus trituberculatus]
MRKDLLGTGEAAERLLGRNLLGRPSRKDYRGKQPERNNYRWTLRRRHEDQMNAMEQRIGAARDGKGREGGEGEERMGGVRLGRG